MISLAPELIVLFFAFVVIIQDFWLARRATTAVRAKVIGSMVCFGCAAAILWTLRWHDYVSSRCSMCRP